MNIYPSIKNHDNPSCIVELFNKETLEKYHTKQLIRILRGQSRRIDISCADSCSNMKICKKNIEQNIVLLKEILKTRPHIPNKKESKEMRKARIKKGK